MAFQGFEAQVDGVPLDEDGLVVDEVERMLTTGRAPEAPVHDPRLPELRPACRCPPSGAYALVELARSHGLLVIEDVAYRELSFGEERPPSLWILTPDVVVQAGTFSKTFFPASASAGPLGRGHRGEARSSQAEH